MVTLRSIRVGERVAAKVCVVGVEDCEAADGGPLKVEAIRMIRMHMRSHSARHPCYDWFAAIGSCAGRLAGRLCDRPQRHLPPVWAAAAAQRVTDPLGRARRGRDEGTCDLGPVAAYPASVEAGAGGAALRAKDGEPLTSSSKVSQMLRAEVGRSLGTALFST